MRGRSRVRMRLVEVGALRDCLVAVGCGGCAAGPIRRGGGCGVMDSLGGADLCWDVGHCEGCGFRLWVGDSICSSWFRALYYVVVWLVSI